MDTSASIARTPYQLQAYARACTCATAVNNLARRSKLHKAIQDIEGYWNVYLAFYGDQTVLFHFQVVDLRDGDVVWRDGRQLRTEEGKPNGTTESNGAEDPFHGRSTWPGQPRRG